MSSTRTFIINVADQNKAGLVDSFQSGGAAAADLLSVRNDGERVRFRFVEPDDATNGRPWKDYDVEAARAVDGITVAIGLRDTAPNGGTFALEYDGDATGLTALAYDISAANLQTALNANPAISADGGVTVTKTGSSFRIQFATVGAKDDFTTASNALTPSSYVSISQTQEGDGSTYEVWRVSLYQRPYVLQDSWAAVAITPVSAAESIEGSETTNSVQVITLGEGAYAGSYSLTVTISSEAASFIVDATTTAEELESLLLSHPEAIGPDEENGIRVTGEIGGPFSIEFINHLGNTDIDPITATNINLALPKMIVGAMHYNGDGLIQAFLDQPNEDTLTFPYEIQIQFPGEEPQTVFQSETTIRRDLINFGATAPAPAGSFPAPGEIARSLYSITTLTGGTDDALDSIPTATLGAGLVVFVNVTGSPVVWRLVAGTDAEDAHGGIVRPDDYAASTNEKVWKSLF